MIVTTVNVNGVRAAVRQRSGSLYVHTGEAGTDRQLEKERFMAALATEGLAERVRSARVEKPQAYALRWSDHAPVTVEFDD